MGTGTIWAKIEPPLTEVFTHTIVTVALIMSISLVDLLGRLLGISGKHVPIFDIPFGDWLFNIEISVATLILVIGAIKAAIALVRS